MLTLHHLEYSQSFRILWLLEALGAEYELKLYNRDPESNLAPDDYKALSPLGTAPVVTDGDLVLAESNAIIDYILDSYPKSPLNPGAGHKDRVRHLFWYHTSPASLMNLQSIEMIFGLLETRSPWPISALLKSVFGQVRKLFVNPRKSTLLNLMEEDLGKQPFFGGDQLTSADITLVYSMYAARDKGTFEGGYPNIHAWFDRIEALDSFKSARAKDNRPHIAFRF
ncbi:glutathione S-transferase family protein [Erythrobacter sp. SCSIO 43205]|uniref:glutathione S-transferase family protein n=1 Tax=Erythrobacter sp. SCSIO 43205 TaxID=2779361 RepID=UPI001CA99A7B|nr:glutathione S-transferase family protein [Erythrobacter sp. SCSIO 43205]UAB77308.1 glutathione S-transferase family protein [Erythrobacter sp. SCSIO 43205]